VFKLWYVNTSFPVFRLTTIYWGVSRFAVVTDSCK